MRGSEKRDSLKEVRGKSVERRERRSGGKRKGESTPKIGSNKLSTIFAGLNTLKRLEIRPVGGPFVHGVPADRHEGLQRVIRARKREEDRVASGVESRGTAGRGEAWRGAARRGEEAILLAEGDPPMAVSARIVPYRTCPVGPHL